MKKLSVLSIITFVFLTVNSHAANDNLNKFYTKYYGITINTPTGFNKANVSGTCWQPSFQLKKAEGWHTAFFLRGLPSISVFYSNQNNSTWMMVGDMQGNEKDSLYKAKMYGDMQLALHQPESAKPSELLKNVKVYTGNDAAKIMNADTVYVAEYILEKPEISFEDNKGSFSHCIAIYAMKAGYTSYVGYILTNDTSDEEKQKRIKTLTDAVRYVNDWTATDEIISTRHSKYKKYIERKIKIRGHGIRVEK